MAGFPGGTLSRILNKLQYAIANLASASGALATDDRIPIADASDDYEIKYATPAEVLTAAVASGRRVSIPDANTAILAANSTKPHLIENVSADRTFTLPTPADGLDFEFIATVGAADGHDWIFTTGSDTNYFIGAIVHLDTDADAAGDEIVMLAPDGNSNSKLQINLPQGGTRVRFICDGTLWVVSGFAVSTTVPAFADQ